MMRKRLRSQDWAFRTVLGQCLAIAALGLTWQFGATLAFSQTTGPSDKIARVGSLGWKLGRTDDGDHVKIALIRAGGPADIAGLKVGDVLLTADGKDLNPSNSHELISGAVGTKITISVLRNGKTFDVIAKRADLLTIAFAAAVKGDLPAMKYLADAYSQGKGVEHDEAKAFGWYLKAANAGDTDSMYLVAGAYQRGIGTTHDDVEAFQWFSKAANGGDVVAMNDLGNCYSNGTGVAKDMRQSFEWYLKAASNGEVEAMGHVAFAYKFGEGTTQDSKQAFTWLHRGADAGNDPYQMKVLGDWYLKGEGVSLNEDEAVAWYKKAAALDNYDAITQLGRCYKNGTGIAKDPEKAVACYRKAAEHSQVDAMFLLGAAYDEGSGVSQNDREAFDWYLKAAKANDKRAMFLVGSFYTEGKGGTMDHEEAMRWFQMAANAGYTPAMVQVASMYATGEGNKNITDLNAGIAWAKKAADAGDADGKELLARLYRARDSR